MIYIDTGAFFARYVARDQYHSSARRAWKELETASGPVFTSNFVLDELFTLLARRTTYRFAADRARAILSSARLTILRPGPEEEEKAVSLFEKFGDQAVSYTDCISFVLMDQARLRRAFTYDRHFQLAGFEIWPTGLTPRRDDATGAMNRGTLGR